MRQRQTGETGQAGGDGESASSRCCRDQLLAGSRCRLAMLSLYGAHHFLNEVCKFLRRSQWSMTPTNLTTRVGFRRTVPQEKSSAGSDEARELREDAQHLQTAGELGVNVNFKQFVHSPRSSHSLLAKT